MFACGTDFDIAFGLMHTVEKAAEVLVKVLSMTNKKRQTIQPDEFRALNAPFGVQINEECLYEKKSDIIGER
jgi:rhamnulose-1-phosphate aldolase